MYGIPKSCGDVTLWHPQWEQNLNVLNVKSINYAATAKVQRSVALLHYSQRYGTLRFLMHIINILRHKTCRDAINRVSTRNLIFIKFLCRNARVYNLRFLQC